MFSTSESGKISARATAVRLLGGADITPQTKSVMKRYGVRGYPSMLVVDVNGLRLHEGDIERSVDGILAALDQAQANAKKIAAAKSGDPAAYLALLKQHDGWTLIAQHFEQLVAEKPSAESHEELAQAYRRTSRTAEADALETKMIALYPKHPRRAVWRVDRVLRKLGTPRTAEEAKSKYTTVIQGLVDLEATAKKEADTSTELAACTKRASLLVQSHRVLERRDEAKPLYERVIKDGGTSPHVASALMGLANLHYAQREFEPALTLLERIVKEFPNTPEARRAPIGIKRLKPLIDK